MEETLFKFLAVINIACIHQAYAVWQGGMHQNRNIFLPETPCQGLGIGFQGVDPDKEGRRAQGVCQDNLGLLFAVALGEHVNYPVGAGKTVFQVLLPGGKALGKEVAPAADDTAQHPVY